MWEYLILILISAVLIFAYQSYLERIKFHAYAPLYILSALICSAVFLPLCLLRPKNVRNIRNFAANFTDPIIRLSSNESIPSCPFKNFVGCKYGYFIYDVYLTNSMFGLKWEVRNRQVLEDDPGAIVVLNHQNVLDMTGACILSVIVNKMTVIAKKMLLYYVPFGTVLYLCGFIFVDREKKSSSVGATSSSAVGSNEIRKTLLKNKTKILIFPEGTRNSSFPEFLKFKKGAFNMAVDAQVPVIPAIVSPYYFINKKNKTFKDGGKMVIECLEPIPTKGLTREDVSELTTRVQTIMQEAYIRLSKEILDQLPPDYPHEYHFNK